VIRLTDEDKLIEFSCQLEETMRWLYATAAKQVSDTKAADVLERLAAAEEGHLGELEASFGVRLENKTWSKPLGAYVRAHVLKGSAPRIASGDVAEILKTAYAIEAGGGRFYRRWLEQSGDPDLQRNLSALVQSEAAHRAWVSECHEELVGTPLTDEGTGDDLVDWPEL
jgi:rubrerythrin